MRIDTNVRENETLRDIVRRAQLLLQAAADTTGGESLWLAITERWLADAAAVTAERRTVTE